MNRVDDATHQLDQLRSTLAERCDLFQALFVESCAARTVRCCTRVTPDTQAMRDPRRKCCRRAWNVVCNSAAA